MKTDNIEGQVIMCMCECVCVYIYIYIYIYIKSYVKMFTNSLGDWGSIPGCVIPKTQKMVLDASLFNTQHYKVWMKGKWSYPGKGVAPCFTPWCSSNWKGSLQVALNYSWPTYLHTHTHIYDSK